MPTHPRNWEARYRAEGFPAGTEPAPFLREVLPLLPRGRALDLAMGAGRNAILLALNGWRVTGIDSCRAALENAAALAQGRGVSVRWAGKSQQLSSKLPRLLLLEADLESSVLPGGLFELVLCSNYLQRSLFASIQRALCSGGMLVYETYTIDQLAFSGGPHNPAHLLQHNELREALPALRILFYRELRTGKGIASLLARKP